MMGMQKSLFVALAIAVSCTAEAQKENWAEVADTDSSVIYIDKTTVRRSGDTVKVWHMVDMKVMGRHEPIDSNKGKQYWSIRFQREYDCKEVKARTLSAATFRGNMGVGFSEGQQNEPTGWNDIPPGTVEYMAWKIVCPYEKGK